MVCLFTVFFPVISFPKDKNVKKNVNGAKDYYHYWANYINAGCDNIRIFDLNWWDKDDRNCNDDDDSGCGEGFFFTLLFSK